MQITEQNDTSSRVRNHTAHGRRLGLRGAPEVVQSGQNAVTLAATASRFPLRSRINDRDSPGLPCIAL
jgi:hypothetical protein